MDLTIIMSAEDLREVARWDYDKIAKLQRQIDELQKHADRYEDLALKADAGRTISARMR